MRSLARLPSLEFNWLPNSLRKGLDTPRVVYSDSAPYGGCYYWRDRGIVEHLGLDTAEGAIIEITTVCPAQSVLAHEYRHHWQRQNARLTTGTVWHRVETVADYRKEIVRYFSQSPFEMDALYFELSVAPNDVSLEWKEWLVSAGRWPYPV
jgi:hypothetical protein